MATLKTNVNNGTLKESNSKNDINFSKLKDKLVEDVGVMVDIKNVSNIKKIKNINSIVLLMIIVKDVKTKDTKLNVVINP